MMETQGEEQRSQATVVIEVDRSKMSASMTLKADGPNPQVPSEQEIVNAIKCSGVRCGISRKCLVELIRSPQFDEPIIFAAGQPPTNGDDATVVYKVNTSRKEAVPKSLESGQVDFRNLDLIETVKEGTLLAVKVPPTDGTPGYNLAGEPLKAKPGKDKVLKMGRNVKVSEDGTEAVAAIDGAVTFNGDRIEVTPVIEIRGDIDYSVGNQDFSGTIVISGSVLSGFVVKAGGDVVIHGTVEAATVKSGGTLTIKGGVVGQGRATLSAAGDVVARFINDSAVRAGGNILTEGPILHSRLEAGGSVLASGKKGLISGGEISASDGVNAEVLGSSMGTKTEITINHDPELPAQIHELTEALRERNEQLGVIMEKLAGFQKVDPAKLPEETRQVLKRTQEQADKMKQEIAEMQAQHEKMKAALEKCRAATVKVNNEIYPGVNVNIAGAQFKVPNEMKALTFARERGEIVTKSTF